MRRVAVRERGAGGCSDERRRRPARTQPRGPWNVACGAPSVRVHPPAAPFESRTGAGWVHSVQRRRSGGGPRLGRAVEGPGCRERGALHRRRPAIRDGWRRGIACRPDRRWRRRLAAAAAAARPRAPRSRSAGARPWAGSNRGTGARRRTGGQRARSTSMATNAATWNRGQPDDDRAGPRRAPRSRRISRPRNTMANAAMPARSANWVANGR